MTLPMPHRVGLPHRSGEPIPGWSGVGDTFACWIGRLAARAKRMSASAAARGVVAATVDEQVRFESIVRSFGHGYHAALRAPHLEQLALALNPVPLPLRGFAYEGAGMGLSVRQALNPRRPHLVSSFVENQAGAYTYLVHVGVGWTLGLVPGARRILTDLDPVLRWLAYDGMGFAHYFFGALRSRLVIGAPSWIADEPYASRAFDQGVGRGLWFAAAGSVDRVPDLVAKFASERHADLWAGIGLAAVYAGRPSSPELRRLWHFADAFRGDLAQGAAFAAKALQRGRQSQAWHDVACGELCGIGAAAAARATDEALLHLPCDGPEPAYEHWRRRIRHRLTAEPSRLFSHEPE